ncbi:hypothetical protein OE88DRAFT_1016352 [Heliocybe sulcata]|uniref:Uncharacterized protein n=1 Tax=Heliocybe sulcata TaxID=5364 RepID=A0A5C3ND07_9AGAM|nr:hypothetical protein OE88DRAFT_1016352 [Heliocybe sulcata]
MGGVMLPFLPESFRDSALVFFIRRSVCTDVFDSVLFYVILRYERTLTAPAFRVSVLGTCAGHIPVGTVLSQVALLGRHNLSTPLSAHTFVIPIPPAISVPACVNVILSYPLDAALSCHFPLPPLDRFHLQSTWSCRTLRPHSAPARRSIKVVMLDYFSTSTTVSTQDKEYISVSSHPISASAHKAIR